MDAILKIFLSPIDYETARQNIGSCLDEEGMDAHQLDFFKAKMTDKTMIIQLFPDGEHFGEASPDNFDNYPENQPAEAPTRAELRERINRAEA